MPFCQIDSTDLFHLGDVLWFSHNSLGHDDERILFCTNDPRVKLILFWDCSLLSENKNKSFQYYMYLYSAGVLLLH